MVDIFEMINIINVKLQGQDSNLVSLCDQINAFSIKINNFISFVKVNNYKEFPTLNDNFNNITIKKVILDHLKKLQHNIKTYFPDTLASLSTFLMNPFEYDSQLIDDSTLRNEFIELITDTRLKSYYIKHTYEEFWCHAYASYKTIGEFALRILVPFGTTYLCEKSFSTLVNIKTKYRNRVDPVPQMIVSISKIKPRFAKLSSSLGGLNNN